jgi:spermidine/putrescine-binding protein
MDEGHIREWARRELEVTSRRMFLQRMGGGALMLAGSSSLLAACGGSSGKTTSDTGKIGGQLDFLGVDGEDGKAIAKPFLDKHGVTLKAAYAPDNDTMLTKLRTGGTKTFDVLTISKDYAPKEVELGFVRELDLERLPNFDKLFPGFHAAPWVTKDGKTYAFPLIWGSEPCVFDPTKWKEMPPSYTDFADPKFKGALTTIDEPNGNQWLLAKSLGFGQDGQNNRITQAELDQVRDAWIEIKKNVVSFSVAYGDQTDLLVRGEASIALNSWQAVVAFAEPKGKKLDFGNPKNDGTYYWSDSYYITSESENAATAYAYIDYMSSPEANAKLAAELQSGTASAAARDLLPADSISTKYEYEIVDTEKIEGDFLESILPPDEPDGDIVGKEAWAKSWQEVKAS